MNEYADHDSATVDWYIIARGNYSEGKKEGRWIYYSDEIITIGEYQNGKEEGEWRMYFFEAGKDTSHMQISFMGNYLGGFEDGVHYYYFSNGKPREERRFHAGVRDGIWKRWDQDGSLVISVTYADGMEQKVDGKKFELEALKE